MKQKRVKCNYTPPRMTSVRFASDLMLGTDSSDGASSDEQLSKENLFDDDFEEDTDRPFETYNAWKSWDDDETNH